MSAKYSYFLLFLLMAYPLRAFTAGIETSEQHALYCRHSALGEAVIESPEHRKYAPDRSVDLIHLALDVTPDFANRSISGKATLTFKPIAKPLQELQLDAVDLNVRSIEGSIPVEGHQLTDEKLIVTFKQPIPVDQQARLTIVYRVEPQKGLYFRTPEMGYPENETELFTQGEPIEARHWYPSFDAPNEKFTSEMTCRVPEGMVVLSNGKLVSEEKDPATGRVAVRWLQEKPHVNYLLSLVAGYFKRVEDRYQEIPLAFYTPPSQIDQAMNSFRDTKDMMGFFEEEIGIPYPWAKYYQVCVLDFHWGGMENTSVTTLNDRTLFTDATENIRTSQGLVAHELAHQWFGDLVTCKDWSHLWLNEGFATYYDHLYDGYKNGRDSMLYGLYLDAKGILNRADDTNSIVNRTFDSPVEQFNYLAYPKGSWILHMLRSQLGAHLYRRCIQTYVERHQYDTVVTEDLNSVIEQLSGRSYDQFFDQWVYHAHHPELSIEYRWDEIAKLAKLTIAQTQKLSERVFLFNFPLDVRFKAKSEIVERTIQVKQKEEDFYFALPSAPDIVRVDPNYTLLAKIDFPVPNAMLSAQLADERDAIGRLMAIEQLSAKKDQDAVQELKKALNHDPFWGVRIEAAKALRAIHSEPALAALLESQKQSDARVRHRVVADIGAFYRGGAYDAARQTLDQEKNPDILAAAISSLGIYHKNEVRELALHYLNSQSYRNVLADAAIEAIRAQLDPEYIDPLLQALRNREREFTSASFARGLNTLAYLARYQDANDPARQFLIQQLNHKKKAVQIGAINALGTLEDPQAIPVLETFLGARKGNPEQAAADKAISAIRAARKPTEDLKELRSEILELQKANRERTKEIKELQKKLEATADQKPAPPSKKRGSPKGRAQH